MKLRRVILLAVIALGGCLLSQAQIARSGERPMEGGGLRTAELLQLPTYRAPHFDQDSARLEMERSSAELRAYLFAHTIEVGLDIIQGGDHTQWSDGTEVWRYRVRSQGAKSLGFFFDQWELPRGAYLYIYSTLDPTQCLGGFGWENNNERASLPIQPIFADDVVIELQAPKGSRPRLHLQELYHGVRTIDGLLRYKGPQVGSPQRLACTPEVACYPEFREVAQSVVVVITGSGAMGTGALVNNTSSNGRPLILTASHVVEANFRYGILSPQQLEEEAAKSVFFFNYQTPMCDSGIQPSATQSIAGAKMLGCHPFTDVALMELDAVPPTDYQVYYAGWNAQPNLEDAYAIIRMAIASGLILLFPLLTIPPIQTVLYLLAKTSTLESLTGILGLLPQGRRVRHSWIHSIGLMECYRGVNRTAVIAVTTSLPLYSGYGNRKIQRQERL